MTRFPDGINPNLLGLGEHIDIVFDGGPSHQSGRFVEVENIYGESRKIGTWINRGDGYWALRLSAVSMCESHDSGDVGEYREGGKVEAVCAYCRYPVADQKQDGNT